MPDITTAFKKDLKTLQSINTRARKEQAMDTFINWGSIVLGLVVVHFFSLRLLYKIHMLHVIPWQLTQLAFICLSVRSRRKYAYHEPLGQVIAYLRKHAHALTPEQRYVARYEIAEAQRLYKLRIQVEEFDICHCS